MRPTDARFTTTVVWLFPLALLISGSARPIGSDGPSAPAFDESPLTRVDDLERAVTAALLASPRGRETMTRVVQSELQRLEGHLRSLAPRQQRAVARYLRRLRVPFAALGLGRSMGGVRGLADPIPAAPAGTGGVAGFVRDALTGTPVPGASVSVAWVPCGGPEIVASIATDPSGAYATPANLLPGTYYVYAQHPSYIGAIHSGQQCAGMCLSTDAVMRGTPVTVGSSTIAVDVSLYAGGAISGTVTNASTNAPLQDILVRWFDEATHRWGSTATTDASGSYTLGGLLDGTYTVTADNYGSEPVLDQVYDGLDCTDVGGCNPTTGTPVTVTAGTISSGVDFALSVGGQIEGTVFPADDDTWVYVFDSGGSYRGSGYADSTGHYTSPALSTGTYYAVAAPRALYLDKPFGGPACIEAWDSSCRTSGSPIAVTAGSTASGIDFLLQPGGSVEGGIKGGLCADIEVYDASGTRLNVWAWGCGAYSTPSKLTTGTYHVMARANHNSGGWVPQLFDRVPCAGCPATTGTPVPVTQGAVTGPIDFYPTTGSELSGTVLTSDGGYLPSVYVEIFDSSGNFAGEATRWGSGPICSAGWTALDELPAGTYHAVARTWASTVRPYRPQLYAGIDCAHWDCPITSGTPIAVDGTTDVTGIDFGLVPWSRTMDMNDDRRGDILWRHSGGALYVWLMSGTSLTSTTYLPPIATNWGVEALGDFDGDRRADVLWREAASGATYMWFMDGARLLGQGYTSSGADNTWTVEAIGDLDGDGRQDVLWRHSGGALYIWLMHGPTLKIGSTYLPPISLAWQIERLGDFNGDGKDDVLWRETGSGTTYLWLMDGASTVGSGYTSGQANLSWTVSGVDDMDGDGKDDILWRQDTGAMYVWLMNGTTLGPGSTYLPPIATNWVIEGLRDLDGEGRADILWRESTSGATYVWFMNGGSKVGEGYTMAQATTDWSIQAR